MIEEKKHGTVYLLAYSDIPLRIESAFVSRADALNAARMMILEEDMDLGHGLSLSTLTLRDIENGLVPEISLSSKILNWYPKMSAKVADALALLHGELHVQELSAFQTFAADLKRASGVLIGGEFGTAVVSENCETVQIFLSSSEEKYRSASFECSASDHITLEDNVWHIKHEKRSFDMVIIEPKPYHGMMLDSMNYRKVDLSSVPYSVLKDCHVSIRLAAAEQGILAPFMVLDDDEQVSMAAAKSLSEENERLDPSLLGSLSDARKISIGKTGYLIDMMLIDRSLPVVESAVSQDNFKTCFDALSEDRKAMVLAYATKDALKMISERLDPDLEDEFSPG